MVKRKITRALQNRAALPGEEWLRKRVERQMQVQPQLKAKIAKSLQRGGFLSPEAAQEAAFHLTDWVVDLEDLIVLFRQSRWNQTNARDVLLSFVSHAPHHLAAAHRIVMGDPVTDVFEIGAVKGTGRAKRKPGATYRNKDNKLRNQKL